MEPLDNFDIQLYNGFNTETVWTNPNRKKRLLKINNINRIENVTYPDVDMWGIRVVIESCEMSDDEKFYCFVIKYGVEESSMKNAIVRIQRKSVGVTIQDVGEDVYKVTDVFRNHLGYVTNYNLFSPNRLVQFIHFIYSNLNTKP